MIVLGVGFTPDGHDSSAALVVDGRLVAAAEEERFTRVKHDGGLPLNAVRFCLAYAALEMSDVDLLALPERPYWSGRASELAWVDPRCFRELVEHGLVRRRSYWHKRLLDFTGGRHWPLGIAMSEFAAKALQTLREAFGALPPIRFHGHHQSHAAAAFHLSGCTEAAVLTVDGRGASESAVIWQGGPKGLRPLFTQSYAHSLGFFYRDCTRYLGLGDFAEGKTMGLAPYGNADRYRGAVAAMLQSQRLPFRYLRSPSAALLGFPARDRGGILDGPYADFAAAAQQAVQDTMALLADSAMRMTGSSNLCLGGGVALNCSANGYLHGMDGVEELFVFPAAGDGGLSVGAALLVASAAGEPVSPRLENSYLGLAGTPVDIEKAIAGAGDRVRARRWTSAAEAAELIVGGAIVGWVQGRMEFGPRALGARSILADPRSGATRDRVNRLKNRELWRPLAPVVLEERVAEYFEGLNRSRFMLVAKCVRPERRAEIEAVVHIDGSARPQTVPRDGLPPLRALLDAFEARTGVPVLLNTSFNSAGEPIVCTPADAIRSFLHMGLDALILEDWIIEPRTPTAGSVA